MERLSKEFDIKTKNNNYHLYDIEKNSFMKKFYLLFSVVVVFGVSVIMVLS